MRADEPSVEALDKPSDEKPAKEEEVIELDGFVDCCVNVKSTNYHGSCTKVEEMNEALKFTISNY